MLKFKKNKNGFTLIEVLLVVVILGILASIAVPRFMTSEKQAKEKSCQIQVSEIRTQIEKYFFNTNGYPASLAILAADAIYFPNGMVASCPVDGTTAYAYNATTGTVGCGVSHVH